LLREWDITQGPEGRDDNPGAAGWTGDPKQKMGKVGSGDGCLKRPPAGHATVPGAGASVHIVPPPPHRFQR